MPSQLFARKSLDTLLADMHSDNRLKRALGPINLTALGVGAVIGAGIFVATGAAAHNVAGPALMLSYVVAGVTCIFAALCYAEFASMAPVAGSAYTYAYTTMGELFAWIIGWDLILEYAVGAATVANGWSGYFQSVLVKLGIVVPMALSGAPYKYDHGYYLPNVKATYEGDVVTQHAIKLTDRAGGEVAKVSKPEYAVHWVRDKDGTSVGAVGDLVVEGKLQNIERAYVNLPAIIIVAIVTTVLVKGISESAGFNSLMVFIKLAAVVFVILVGAYFVKPHNWVPFAPYGWTGVSFFGIPLVGQTNAGGEPVGMLAGAAIIFFAYIGFDSVSTHAEEAKEPQRDVPIGIIASLVICTVLYIGVVAVLTGMVKYDQLDTNAGVSDAFKKAGLPWAEFIIAAAGVAGITSVLLVMMLSAPRVFLAMARDGLVPKRIFADVHPTFKTPWISTILIGFFVTILAGWLPIDALLHLTNIGTLFAFVIVCGAVLIMRQTNPQAHRPFRCPFVPVVPILGIASCLLLMLSLPAENWYRLFGWLAIGLVIYFCYGIYHSTLGKELRGEKPATT
ncbi:MAG TPA: amino acid permease [Pirellulaceae bacterium]|nr:amino acid permease [Pirellulaceae bacterium]